MTTTTAPVAPATTADPIHAYFHTCEDIAKLIAYLAVACYAAGKALREQFDDITGRRPIQRSARPAPTPIAIQRQGGLSPHRIAEINTFTVKELRQQGRALRAAGRWSSDTPVHMANRELLITQLLAWQ